MSLKSVTELKNTAFGMALPSGNSALHSLMNKNEPCMADFFHRHEEESLTGGLESRKPTGRVKALAAPEGGYRWQRGGAVGGWVDGGSQAWNTGNTGHAGSSDQVGHASP